MLGEQRHVRGVVIDRPEVVAAPAAEATAVGARLEMRGGDFFSDVPAGGQVYVLSRIVHDWPDREAATLLRTCSAAMAPGARLCLLEHLAPEPTEVPEENRLELGLKDLNMLVLVGGKERTIDEYRELLGGVGLTVESVRTGETCSVLVAVR